MARVTFTISRSWLCATLSMDSRKALLWAKTSTLEPVTPTGSRAVRDESSMCAESARMKTSRASLDRKLARVREIPSDEIELAMVTV